MRTPIQGEDPASLEFLGAAGTVTGSRHLLATGRRRVLLDCGLFQGLKALRLRNRSPFPFEAGRLDAVVLSHAHLDHSGALPLLAKRGFQGPVYCTPGTRDLLGVMLPDAARLLEEAAAHANDGGYSRHRPALPLYTAEDARRALGLLEDRAYGRPFMAADGVRVLFRKAGHILGSATVEAVLDGKAPVRLVYSGDLGRWDQPILEDPEPVCEADVLLIESTYGDRLHTPRPEEALARIVNEASARGGALLIPCFAVGRAQSLLWRLKALEEAGRIPRLPGFIDSPMANRVSEIICRHAAHPLAAPCPLCTHRFSPLETTEESKGLNRREGAFVVIAGSGMITGGRILHHLERRLGDPRTTVLLPGFQAAGTRGRALQDGAAQVRIHGRWIPVRAKVEVVDGLSAHADQGELLRWLSAFTRPPRQTHVVHGEPEASEALASAIRERLGWEARVAADGERVTLS